MRKLKFIFILFFLTIFFQTSAKASDTVVIRAGYNGDINYRKMAEYSISDIEKMGTNTYRYTYITNVGTIMEQIANGTNIITVLQNSGIDYNSIDTINVKGNDGFYRSLSRREFLDKTRMYFPNLRRNWDYENGKAKEGAQKDGLEVPMILAIKEYSTKSPKEQISEEDMGNSRCFRLCFGQSDLTSVTSNSSVQNVTIIDVTLLGYPPIEPTDVRLNSPVSQTKIGASFQIKADVFGDEYYMDKKLIWTSSDTTIAKVDQNGFVTVVGKGDVIITATAVQGGKSASVTIHCKDDEEIENPSTKPEVKPIKPTKPEETTKEETTKQEEETTRQEETTKPERETNKQEENTTKQEERIKEDSTKKSNEIIKEEASLKNEDTTQKENETKTNESKKEQSTSKNEETDKKLIGREIHANEINNIDNSETKAEDKNELEMRAGMNILGRETWDPKTLRLTVIILFIGLIIGGVSRLLKYRKEI